MSRNTKIVIALCVVLAIFVGGLIYYARARAAGQTAAATGTVVSAERTGRAGKYKTYITFSYQAGAASAIGRDYVGGSRVDEYPAGRQLPICYNPSETSSMRIAHGPCG